MEIALYLGVWDGKGGGLMRFFQHRSALAWNASDNISHGGHFLYNMSDSVHYYPIWEGLCNVRYILTTFPTNFLGIFQFLSIFFLLLIHMPSHEPNETPNNKHDLEIRATKVILPISLWHQHSSANNIILPFSEYFALVNVLRVATWQPTHPGHTKYIWWKFNRIANVWLQWHSRGTHKPYPGAHITQPDRHSAVKKTPSYEMRGFPLNSMNSVWVCKEPEQDKGTKNNSWK